MKNVTLFIGLLLTFTLASAADEPKSKAPSKAPAAPSKEVRDRMAEMHTKMGECLKSDKDFSACHDEMQAACDGIDGGRCGFGPGKRGGRGKGRGGGPGFGPGNGPRGN